MLFFYVIDLISPPEGRNNSGANWRKRDVCGPVQGAVAEGEGRSESCGPPEAMTALCLTTVRLALARLKGRSSPSSDRCRSLFRHLSGGMFLPDKGYDTGNNH